MENIRVASSLKIGWGVSLIQKWNARGRTMWRGGEE